jgi:hypothetical protein
VLVVFVLRARSAELELTYLQRKKRSRNPTTTTARTTQRTQEFHADWR